MDKADRGWALAGAVAGVLVTAAAFFALRYSHPPHPAWTEVRTADFVNEHPAADVRMLADWVVQTNDAGKAGFIIVDKKNARMYVFSRGAFLRAASPVLLGAQPGDDSAPGIGSRPLDQVAQQEKTTPAGRFVAERGHDARGEDVVWVDYDLGISMHRILTTNSGERRPQRMASGSAADHRISYGCINVPLDFFESYVGPMFASSRANVYIMPDTKTVQQVFGLPGLNQDVTED
jgi:hypothetical protein